MSDVNVFPTFLPNRGPKLDAPAQFLPDAWSSNSRNMEFRDEKIQGRNGLVLFDSATLSGPVLRIEQFWQTNNTYDLLFFTDKDIYKYDFDNDRFDYLTRQVNGGTIEIAGGSLDTVTGTGTNWNTSAHADYLVAGDYIAVNTTSYHSGVTFYEIASVDSDTQLTLTGDAVAVTAGASYRARHIYQGDETNIWDGIQFLDTNLGDIFVCVNGVDKPQYYDPDGDAWFKDFGTLPTGLSAAKYVWILNNRIVFLYTVEGGANQAIRVRWGGVADYTDWNDLHFADLDLPDASSFIIGGMLIGDDLVIPKEYGGAYVMRHVDTDDIFTFDFNSSFEGSYAAFSLTQHKNGIYYLGYDNRFHFWDFVNDENAFSELNNEFLNMDPNESLKSYAYRVGYSQQIRWILPYDDTNNVSPVLVYDYEHDHAEIWEYSLTTAAERLRSIGEFLNVEDLYVDDTVWGEYYVDEQEGYWDDRTFLANAPIILYGTKDGKVFKADQGSDDNGTSYTRSFCTKRLDHGTPQQFKRVKKHQLWLEAQAAGDLTVKMRKNDDEAFDVDTKTVSMIETNKDVIKPFVTWDKRCHDYELELSATSPLGILGFLSYIHGKRRTD